MRTFGAIFAALTLALSASAAAIYPRDTSVTNVGGLAGVTTTVDNTLNHVKVIDQENHRRQLPPVGNGVASTLGNTPAGGVVSGLESKLGGGGVVRRGEQGVPDVIVGVIAEIKAIVVKINADIDVKLAVELVTEIKVALCNALVSINAIVKVGGDAQLYLNGEVVTLVKLGALIAELIVVVVPCLKIVLAFSACVSIVAEIVVALTAIVAVAVELGVNVAVCITALLTVDVKAILELKIFASLCAVLLIK